MTSKRSIFLAALCGLALVGAGCGGDDDDNAALSYDDSTAEINQICAGADDIGEGLTGEPSNDAPLLVEAGTRFQAVIDEIRELDVNEELEAARDDFVANGEEQVALVEEAQQQAEAGDRNAYRQTLESGQALDEESNEFASQLGAEECID